jgi:hypothetical protein
MTLSVALSADRLRNNSAAVHKVAIVTAAPHLVGNTSLALSTYMGWGVPGLCMSHSVLIEGGAKYEYLCG